MVTDDDTPLRLADTARISPSDTRVEAEAVVTENRPRSIAGKSAGTIRTGRAGQGGAITIERIERAIHLVAQASVDHDLDLGPTLRRLEAEREKLLQAASGVDYARAILARTAQRKQHDAPPTSRNARFY